MIPRSLVAARYGADFDSSVAMFRAIAKYLKGREVGALGVAPSSRPLAAALSRLPRAARRRLYPLTGWQQGVPMHLLPRLRTEDLSEWIARLYGPGPYQAVAIGSGSGALVHLCAALGIPWLPQTVLVPVRQRGIDPDEPRQALAAMRGLGDALLRNNDDIQLHHMHDPSTDRPMVARMAYFRMKRLRLGATFERFLEQRLAPGGMIFLVEAQRPWPTTRVDDRYIFQFGALSGATEQDYFEATTRTETFLQRMGSHRRRWDPPEPDALRPEAEWGFEAALRDDVEHVAQRLGYALRRIVFREPEHLSPLVADLYDWWNQRRALPARRLLVESYNLVEPMLALRTGSVPLWMKFNMQPDLDALLRYLDGSPPWDEILLTLFSQGVESIGLVDIDAWRDVLRRARQIGRLVGVDERSYPHDAGAMFRFGADLSRHPAQHPIPGPLSLAELDAFLAARRDRYRVQCVGENSATSG